MRKQVGDVDRTITIPSMQLRGTRASKRAQIDRQISRLLAIRRRLASDLRQDAPARRSRHDSSARGWWMAGAALAAVFVLVMFLAWATSGAGAESVMDNVSVVGKVF